MRIFKVLIKNVKRKIFLYLRRYLVILLSIAIIFTNFIIYLIFYIEGNKNKSNMCDLQANIIQHYFLEYY